MIAVLLPLPDMPSENDQREGKGRKEGREEERRDGRKEGRKEG